MSDPYVHVTEAFPASVEVRVLKNFPDAANADDRSLHPLNDRLQRAKAAGVRLQTIRPDNFGDGIYNAYEDLVNIETHAFRLSRAADAPEGNETEGLQWIGGSGGALVDRINGGALAHVL